MIRLYKGKWPSIAPTAYVDETALVIGDVHVGEEASIWPMCVVRGDVHSIRIGHGSNVQDGSVLHVTHDGQFSPGGAPLVIGAGVTVGHRVTLHGCEIGDYCLVGMSSTVMDGAKLAPRLMIGAASLVPPGRTLESGYLYLGSPVSQVRRLKKQELEFLEYSARHYVHMREQYLDPATHAGR